MYRFLSATLVLVTVLSQVWAGGADPNIRVDIDGKAAGNVSPTRDGWQTLRLDATVAKGEHEIALSFTNDFYDPPADRNLRIAHLTIR